ncbi:sensor histidine kinase [Sphingomonas sp. GlSt437]|uniref:sensor histidine kinase n=1 Tax=Sphingomonas sp. GlSt437 TaxID=3389970 RepID=UPI003A866E68
MSEQPTSPERLRAMLDAIPQMVWSTLPDGYHDFYNARWYEFTGMPIGTTDGEGWNDMFHPDDQERAWTLWRHSLATGEPYEIEYRLRHHSGVYRWTLGRALPLRDAAGTIVRWFGTCTDIDEFKRAEQSRELISAELSHRMKNIFAVVSSLIALSARDHPEARDFAATIQARIAALARANDYVRPHVGRQQFRGLGNLKGLIAALIEPYRTESDGRIHVHGHDLDIGIRTATSLALVLHELATNAVKYGALSVVDGRVDIDAQAMDGWLTLVWRESGGPAIPTTPERRGFGTEMAQRAASAQLRGTIENDWRAEGLVMTLKVPIEGLDR